MDQSRIAAIVGASIMATTIADKVIERFWPSRRVNSILDVTLLLLRGVQGALAADSAGRRQERPGGRRGGGEGLEDGIAEDFPNAVAELMDVASSRRTKALEVTPPPASDPAYWERDDIKAWAAAHPQLAKTLRRRHGLDKP